MLVASGDPNLSQRIQPDGRLAFENEDHAYDGSPETKAVPGDPLAVLRELAAQVAKAGIKSIAGHVVVDTSLFPDQGPDSGTGVTISPIVVNDNLVDVTVTPGAHPGDPVTIAVSPQTPYVNFVNHATTGLRKSDATIDMSADVRDTTGRHRVTITGSQPVGASVLYAYRVPEPAAFAQAALTVALDDAGVSVQQPAALQSSAAPSQASYVPANLVAEHVSPPLSEDAYITLKVSDNLHAALMPYLWAVYLAHAKERLPQGRFRARGADSERSRVSTSIRRPSRTATAEARFSRADFMVRYLAWARDASWYPLLACAACRSWALTARS